MKATNQRSRQPDLKTLQRLANSALWEHNLCTWRRHTKETSFDVSFQIRLRRCQVSKDKHITKWNDRGEMLGKTAQKIMHKDEEDHERGKKH